MVGHHLQRHNLYLGIIAGDAPPFVADTLPQRRQLHAGRIGRILRRLAAARHPAEERTTPLGDHRHHIHHAPRVVMVHTAAQHGGLLLAGKGLPAFVGFVFHGLQFLCKDTKKSPKGARFGLKKVI